MVLPLEDVFKLLLAVLLGGLIGAEREHRDKAAGFRTIILICTGATLFTVFSLRLGGAEDPVRIAASIVSGVGFLGAGAILRSGGRVIGLTTAATIWLAAALGMGIGGGYYLLAGATTVLLVIVLLIFPKVETHIDSVSDTRTYEVAGPAGLEQFHELRGLIAGCGLRIDHCTRSKSGREMVCTWSLSGSPGAHDQLAQKLMGHAGVTRFTIH